MRYLVVVLTISLILLSGGMHGVLAQSKTTRVEEIYNLVNKYRVKKGLRSLTMNEAICREAAKHSRNMANGTVSFGHDGFNDRFKKLTAAIPGANAMGENVAYSMGDAEHVVDNWLNSPPHKKNIEGDYDLTGVGIAVSSSGQVYYTQIFIKKSGR